MREPRTFKPMRLLIATFFVALGFSAAAQDNTRSFGNRMSGAAEARIAVLPFEPRMIISDLHRDMCVKNNMSSREVREALAGGFCYAMRNTAPEMAEADVFGWDDEWPEALERLYKELGYKNAPVKKRETEETTEAGAFIAEGELRHRYDTLTRFMQPVIPQQIIVDLAKQTGTDYILMVSQLDIVNLGELVRVNPGKTDFYVRLHYALFSPEGELLDGGLVSHQLDTRTYDPSDIARNEFKFVTEALYKAIFQSSGEDEDSEAPAGQKTTSNG